MEIENGLNETNKGKRVGMLICWLLGNGCLFAWNSMLTIEDYYLNLYPKFHPTRLLTLVYQPFAIGTLVILALNISRINTRSRVLSGYSVFFVASLSLVILDLISHGRGGIWSFICTCIVSGAFGFASACTEGGVVGDISAMCPEFVQSFSAGMGTAGVLTSVLRILTKMAFEKAKNGLRKGAIVFFVIAAFFQLSCIITYAHIFPTLPIVKYHRLKAANEGSKTVLSTLAVSGIQTEQNQEDVEIQQRHGIRSNRQLICENTDFMLNLFLTYVLTLSIFPGFLSEDVSSHELGSWYPLILVAIFNVSDLSGRFIPTANGTSATYRRCLTIFVALRVVFIPAFYLNAQYGTSGSMIALTSFLGLTNGYLTVCVFTAAPRGYKGPEQNALGNLLVLCLITGIAAGVLLDWLWLVRKGWK